MPPGYQVVTRNKETGEVIGYTGGTGSIPEFPAMTRKSAILFFERDYKAKPPVEIQVNGLKQVADIEPLGNVQFVK